MFLTEFHGVFAAFNFYAMAVFYILWARFL